MKEKVAHSVTSGESNVTWHYTTGQVEDLSLAAGQIRWIRGLFGLPYGVCYLDKRASLPDGICHTYEYMTDLRLTVCRTLTEEGYQEHYVWQNVGKKPIEIKDGEVGVYVTFAEQYDIRQVSLPYRAFTHVMQAGNVFYLYNARMNGAPDGVGLVLQEGVVGQLTEERLHPAQRGNIAVTLPACTLQPEEQREWRWLVFAYADEQSYWRTVRHYSHKITLSTLCPEAGQTLTVAVDDMVPPEVILNGERTPNPFVVPLGRFTVQPNPEDSGMVLTLEGKIELLRWVDGYRHWGIGNGNPRRHLTDCNLHLALYHEYGDSSELLAAQAALSAYYRTMGAYRHPQVGIPAEAIMSNEVLKAQFARHVEGVLSAKGRYTAERVWATYRMLQVADAVFPNRYSQALAAAAVDVAPLFKTPFGRLFMQE